MILAKCSGSAGALRPNAPAKNEATAKTQAATKSDPKPLPDAKARQEALKETTKKAGPAQ
jgi:hypothetical protein